MIKNKIIIITAPSGAGKTSITRHLLKTFPELKFSISAATRPPRSNEAHGIDYYFMPVEEFQQHIQQNDFIEWEMVYDGKYYGTLNSELELAWAENRVPILDIDVKGAIHVQSQYPQSTFSIFIMAPSIDVLKARLERRGSETVESVETRINKAAFEISFHHQFSYVIVNDNLSNALGESERVVKEFLEK